MFWYFHATLFWSLSKDACGFVQWMCIACARYDSSTPRGPPMDIRPRAGLKSVLDVFGIFDLTALASFQSGIFWVHMACWHNRRRRLSLNPKVLSSWKNGLCRQDKGWSNLCIYRFTDQFISDSISQKKQNCIVGLYIAIKLWSSDLGNTQRWTPEWSVSLVILLY